MPKQETRTETFEAHVASIKDWQDETLTEVIGLDAKDAAQEVVTRTKDSLCCRDCGLTQNCSRETNALREVVTEAAFYCRNGDKCVDPTVPAQAATAMEELANDCAALVTRARVVGASIMQSAQDEADQIMRTADEDALASTNRIYSELRADYAGFPPQQAEPAS